MKSKESQQDKSIMETTDTDELACRNGRVALKAQAIGSQAIGAEAIGALAVGALSLPKHWTRSVN